MFDVQLITTANEFSALEWTWNEAVEQAQVPHPFLRYEWIKTWWECFGTAHRLNVLVIRDRGQVSAIAPLMLERAQMYGVPIRRLRLMHNDHTPRADFILAAPSDEHLDLVEALWSAIAHQRGVWDVLQLGQLTDDSATLALMLAAAGKCGCATGVWESGAAPFLELASDWDTYAATLSAKFRQNLRNRLSRLTQLGDPVFEILSDAKEMREALPDVFRLEKSDWKQDNGTAIECDPAVRRFYTRLFDRAKSSPWLRLLFLSVNGKRIATSIAAIYRGRLFLLKTGFDPEHAKCSPFKLLTYFAVRYACDHGLQEVDFLGDPEPWKMEWTSTTRKHDWGFVFSDTPRARLLHPIKFRVIPALRRIHSSGRCTSQPFRA
jgi:CelD/BcsL family acetyltransferase involved in cellulose biosynthesis